MNDTPRTDTAINEGWESPGGKFRRVQVGGVDIVCADFARELERELAEARRCLSQATLSLQMLPWWRDRFDDIEDDARGLMRHALGYSELHGMIEGIRVVAEQARDGMTNHLKAHEAPTK